MVFFWWDNVKKKILLIENVMMKLIALYNEYIVVKAFYGLFFWNWKGSSSLKRGPGFGSQQP